MGKKDGKKAGGTRNENRRNGKAWSKKKLDDEGRPLTGKGKPSGKSVQGRSVTKTMDEQIHTYALAEIRRIGEKRGSGQIVAVDVAEAEEIGTAFHQHVVEFQLNDGA